MNMRAIMVCAALLLAACVAAGQEKPAAKRESTEPTDAPREGRRINSIARRVTEKTQKAEDRREHR